MTDAVWIAIVAAFVAIFTQPVLLWFKSRADKRDRDDTNSRLDEVARRQEERADRQERAQTEALTLARSTHAFVNSQFGDVLKTLLSAYEQILELQRGGSSKLSPATRAALKITEGKITRVLDSLQERTDIAEAEVQATAADKTAKATQDVAVATEKVAAQTKRIADKGTLKKETKS